MRSVDTFAFKDEDRIGPILLNVSCKIVFSRFS